MAADSSSVTVSALDRPAESERRFSAINRVALGLFASAPVAGLLAGGILLGIGVSAQSAVAGGCVFLAVLWGFLGSLSWVTAVGAETTARALATIVDERRAIATACVDPDHGNLSLAPEGEAGALSEVLEPAKAGRAALSVASVD